MTAGPGVKVPAGIRVTFPETGIIRIRDATLFATLDGEPCRRFLQAALRLPAIRSATFTPARKHCVDLRYNLPRSGLKQILNQLALALGKVIDDPMAVAAPATALNRHGVVRYRRYAGRVTGWRAERERVGSVRLTNPVLYRKRALCEAIERELMSALGVSRYNTDALKSRVDIEYDPRQISLAELVEMLDTALAATDHPDRLDKINRELTICTVSVPLAAAAQFAVPALLPPAGLLFAYTALPTFKGAWNVLTKERRLGVDVLDAVVVLACLGTGEVFAGTILCWCLSFGRFLVGRTEDRSKKMLLGAFGKQPRFVWLLIDGQEIQAPLAKLKQGDIVAVNTGDMVPADGVIVEGLAMIDQHTLTGESTPAEKGIGDQAFASTIVVAGKIFVSVERSGEATTTAKIAQILNDTAGYRLASQQKGEQLADQAVVPTLAVGGLALGTIGPQGAAAVLNSDMGTGIRMAAPLAMLSTLALCSQRGVLVKDGRALDLLCEVDTVLFDKTGTLTRERPEVGRIVAANGHSAIDILRYAAAAEHRFHHPIARAILQKAEEERLDLPAIDHAQYSIGHGISVGVDRHRIRVGSRRFMELEGIALTPEVTAALEAAHREGHSMVMVAVDDELGGALELRASIRPEVPEIIKGLRARGIRQIAIISGDHEAPTRKLAAALGIDRYFAQVLPTEKADYVEKLQQEGRKVCFVGDGINDAIALKKANVSISLRGATSIATDTAHVVFMEPGLGKLCELLDVAAELQRNVRLSWGLILAPNIACIAGVFTLGFGIGASVLTNNVAALGALLNGVRPMRKVAASEAERRHLLELQLRQSGFSAGEYA
ncbi:MAG: heavy metal translocating P-type ATPase [Alphaproteobacteria bacterium]|nr:heavy metal translocating P-type ATPase [Alphaproteobacteria bacterium]MBV8411502.1 heavy metal translocating P-type ATPase [Alphaproteobacteria bacterium]